MKMLGPYDDMKTSEIKMSLLQIFFFSELWQIWQKNEKVYSRYATAIKFIGEKQSV